MYLRFNSAPASPNTSLICIAASFFSTRGTSSRWVTNCSARPSAAAGRPARRYARTASNSSGSGAFLSSCSMCSSVRNDVSSDPMAAATAAQLTRWPSASVICESMISTLVARFSSSRVTTTSSFALASSAGVRDRVFSALAGVCTFWNSASSRCVSMASWAWLVFALPHTVALI